MSSTTTNTTSPLIMRSTDATTSQQAPTGQHAQATRMTTNQTQINQQLAEQEAPPGVTAPRVGGFDTEPWAAGGSNVKASAPEPFGSPKNDDSSSTDSTLYKLSRKQINTFLADGILVVENVLNSEELEHARDGLLGTLRRYGVHFQDDPLTTKNLLDLSSTNGSGGVLDIFYQPFQLTISSHPKLWDITSQLWAAAYTADQIGPTHPYGPFDPTKGYMYLDRIGYRLPTVLAQAVGSKKRPIQRSLTPHLDCCPETLYSNEATKYRPIQCFVSLSDTLLPNHGGFEAVKGFHREFHTWDRRGSRDSDGSNPPLCIGEYTHIRPKEDKAIMDRVEHVPVAAGSAVLWDHRYEMSERKCEKIAGNVSR
jgi:hypothetical protein